MIKVRAQTPEFFKTVLFIVFGLIFGCMLEFALKYTKLRIPYIVLIFFSGIIFSVICIASSIQVNHYLTDSIVSTDLILYGLLPTLLFGETLRLNWLRVKQSFISSVLLAGPKSYLLA